MNYPKYDLYQNDIATQFEFVSTGTNGSIEKGIVYSITQQENVYNLGFGDIKKDENGEYYIDDLAVSNNGDFEIILATVAKTAYTFTEAYPDVKVVFRGSTPQRTRLYRRAINKEFHEISKTFDIFGAVLNEDDSVNDVPFEKNKDFDGYIIKRKT